MQRFSLPRRMSSSMRLSVSSVGSEAMQPQAAQDLAAKQKAFSILGRIGGDATTWINEEKADLRTAFSILGRIGGDATQAQADGELVSINAFSILGRIGGDATTIARRSSQRLLSFQYPRSDRRRCNVEEAVRVYLSAQTFSILGRIGGDATTSEASCAASDVDRFQYPRSDRRRCNYLCSVSGAEALRAFSILGRIGGDATTSWPRQQSSALTFSILGRIGGDATTDYIISPTSFAELSVSSVGSEAMQLEKLLVQASRDQPFSILGRIGGDATGPSRSPAPLVLIFQYPRSDRRRCNAADAGALPGSADAFSILGRIGGDATLPISAPANPEVPFQYPRSDRRRCNSRSCGVRRIRRSLSVSSVGSEAMQPDLRRGAGWEDHPFQYPRSDRRRCNVGLPTGARGGSLFQYPRSDRRRCNHNLGSLFVAVDCLSVSSVGSEAMQPPQPAGSRNG